MFKYISQEIINTIEIKNSRFIAILSPFHNTEELAIRIQDAQGKYPKASHYCYAYIIGDPHNSINAGSSDAGEPKGTAGKVMHSVLIKNNLGNICVVIARYFGGVKLGAGGLSRAYGKAVGQVIKNAVLIDNIAVVDIDCECDFAHEQIIRNIVKQYDGKIVEINYSENVKIKLQVAESRGIVIINDLINNTNGKIKIIN